MVATKNSIDVFHKDFFIFLFFSIFEVRLGCGSIAIKNLACSSGD